MYINYCKLKNNCFLVLWSMGSRMGWSKVKVLESSVFVVRYLRISDLNASKHGSHFRHKFTIYCLFIHRCCIICN